MSDLSSSVAAGLGLGFLAWYLLANRREEPSTRTRAPSEPRFGGKTRAEIEAVDLQIFGMPFKEFADLEAQKDLAQLNFNASRSPNLPPPGTYPPSPPGEVVPIRNEAHR